MMQMRFFRSGAAVVGMLGASAALLVGWSGCAKNRFELPAAVRTGTGSQIEEAKRLATSAQKADDEGRTEDAIEQYRRAVATYREFPGAWLNLGVLLMNNKQNLEAVEAFKVAADLAPNDPAPLFNIGVLWEKLGWYQDALKHYNEALTREPSYLPALRRSIHLEVIGDTQTEKTLERIKRAMVLENDALWKARFDQYRRRIEQKLHPPREGPREAVAG